MSEHDGHRERLRRRFLKSGFESFEPHEVLELVLTYAIPRRDTNHLAHELIKHFGSLDKVFDANIDELKTIKGIGDSAAFFLTIIPPLLRFYCISRQSTIKNRIIFPNSLSVSSYVIPYFMGRTIEVCYLLCMNSDSTPISLELISTGTVSSINMPFKEIINKLIQKNAACAIICHNHPEGSSSPSMEDISFTLDLDYLLEAAGIPLIDHIIIGTKDYFSFCDHYIIGPNRKEIDDFSNIDLTPKPYN